MMRFAINFAALVCAFGAANPSAGQDHSQHQDQVSMEDGGNADVAAEQAADGEVDHSEIDHRAMGHVPITPATQQIPSTGNSTSGPIIAADAVWGADAMRQSRDDLYSEHGSQRLFWFQTDRLEASTSDDGNGFVWDVQAYYGGDIHKLWFKSEGEGMFGEGIESAEMQALYSRAIAPFFDLQTGLRQDLTGSERTYAVVGIQGLAPYEFEIDAALFLSTNANVTARVEAEYDQRITPRVILQPRVEAEFSAQEVAAEQIGSGLTAAEVGLRIRYEIKPEFAPYIGFEQKWSFGDTKRLVQAGGGEATSSAVVAGVRFWF